MHSILSVLNVADLAFMAAGIAVALLMILLGGISDRPTRGPTLDNAEAEPQVPGRPRYRNLIKR